MILLFFCYLYIQKNPAEKISIFSGFEVMYQRAEIFVNKVLNRNSEALKSKFDYEKAYQELIMIGEGNGCNDKQLVQEMKDTLEELKNESTKTISDTLPGYIRKANEYKMRVATQCKK
ncbi:TPA: hypothetical protein DEP21_00415 [Patescibacteria group bacterium]|nr:hypothetical protein [Candidatus Gracilibacteria bacterium]